MRFRPAISGDAITGLRAPASGVIRDLAVAVTGFGAAEVTFAAELDNAAAYEVGVYVDGELAARVPATETRVGLASLAEGPHTISAYTNPIGEAWPDYHGDPEGTRAYITWRRCADTTCRAYKVYWDAGAGGAAETLMAELTQVRIEEAINRRGAEDEAGRITWYGGFSGDTAVNDVVSLVLSSSGECEYSCLAGSGAGTFAIGQTLMLPYGVVVEILSEAEDYGATSTFDIPVGPATFYLSGRLDPGDYKFAVTALDEAGNETEVSAPRLVRIYDTTPGVPGVHVTWQTDPEAALIGWNATAAAAAGIVSVAVYSNLSLHFGGLMDHVIEDAPMGVVPAANAGAAISRADSGDGLVKLYLRPIDADGVERQAVELVTFNMPPTAADQGIALGKPTNVRVIPRPAGALEVTWDYRFDQELDGLTGFEVALAAETGEQVFTGTVGVLPGAGSGFPVGEFALSLAGPYVGERFAVVRAYAGAAARQDSDEAVGVGDAEAPEFTAVVRGVSQ